MLSDLETKIPLSKVLVYQSIGFLVIIALSWFVEFTGLRQLIFGNHPYISDFRESALEMLLVLVVWFLTTASTRRLLKHLHYLQQFMRICAWCHHIHYKGEWISLEEFLRSGFDTPTTHGICPKCMKQQMAAIEKAKQAQAARASAESNATVPQAG